MAVSIGYWYQLGLPGLLQGTLYALPSVMFHALPKQYGSDMNQVVWIKRDFRIQDHEPLSEALAAGPTLVLYVLEPELWQQPSASKRHWQMTLASLEALDRDLNTLGGALCIRTGTMISVLNTLHQELGSFRLLAHEETGEAWGYERDQAVIAWCSAQGVEFQERRQFGVFRGLRDRDGWSKRWRAQMTQDQAIVSQGQPWLSLPSTEHWQQWRPELPGREIVLDDFRSPHTVLEDFLSHRGERYHLEMSSPVTAPDACSRLSRHLAYGRISMRQVAQRTWDQQRQVRSLPPGEKGTWPKALSSFQSRLHWHCHFIQKFESEPEIQYQNMARSCDGLREDTFGSEKFRAWACGETGYPFVDACMRYLNATGWINFRMRAMLVSFAAYDLWLHWREPALHLARLFTDFEPGIHYAQVQMQSGTTGINTLRIYNPVKQSMDQDPQGTFIKQWIPELAGFDELRIHAPWQATPMEQLSAGCTIGQHYPGPIVDHLEASRFARHSITARRRSDQGKDEQQQVLAKHGSRKRTAREQTTRPGHARDPSPNTG